MGSVSTRVIFISGQGQWITRDAFAASRVTVRVTLIPSSREAPKLAWRGHCGQAAAGLVDLAGEGVADGVHDVAGGLEDLVQVDAVLDAQAVQQVDEVFGSQVAGRARAGERAAA